MTFLECLFNHDESTCLSPTPKGIYIFPILPFLIGEPITSAAFFSINPMDPTKTRADSAVTKYRNILIEMDKMPIARQDEYIETIELPYSTAVFSGSKSIHYIISLENSLSDERSYRNLVKRIYKAVGNDYVDQANKNPSRFSRFPGHIRVDTGKEQKLLAIKGRISITLLEAWLHSRGVEAEEIWDNLTPESRSTFKNPSRLYAGTKNFLMYGAPTGEWNPRLFKAATDLYRCGYSEEEVYKELLNVTGTLDFNDNRTIASALRNEKSKYA